MNNDKKTAKNRERATSAPPMVQISQHGLYTPNMTKTVVSQKLVKLQYFRRICVYSVDGQCCYKLEILTHVVSSTRFKPTTDHFNSALFDKKQVLMTPLQSVEKPVCNDIDRPHYTLRFFFKFVSQANNSKTYQPTEWPRKQKNVALEKFLE